MQRHRLYVQDVLRATLGGMTLINMPMILYLGKYAFRALRDYEKQLKAGGGITFRKKDIDLPHNTNYWN